jgi:hypothetical protein
MLVKKAGEQVAYLGTETNATARVSWPGPGGVFMMKILLQASESVSQIRLVHVLREALLHTNGQALPLLAAFPAPKGGGEARVQLLEQRDADLLGGIRGGIFHSVLLRCVCVFVWKLRTGY